ncbi:MAG: hypothetical protein JNK40_10335 [Chromatiales bacterium]|nr:hypothetical protein [Chromatiales bacterium]
MRAGAGMVGEGLVLAANVAGRAARRKASGQLGIPFPRIGGVIVTLLGSLGSAVSAAPVARP